MVSNGALVRSSSSCASARVALRRTDPLPRHGDVNSLGPQAFTECVQFALIGCGGELGGHRRPSLS